MDSIPIYEHPEEIHNKETRKRRFKPVNQISETIKDNKPKKL